VGLTPVLALTVLGVLWGDGWFDRRYPGQATATYRVRYPRPLSQVDAQRIEERIRRADLRGTVQAQGQDAVVTLTDVRTSAGEWWLRRVGARRGRVQIQQEAEADEDLINRLMNGSDRPDQWTEPPGELEWGHWRCPGKHCRAVLLHPGLLPPQGVVRAEPRFDPDDWSATVHVWLTDPAARAVRDPTLRSGGGFVITLDGRVLGQVDLEPDDTSADVVVTRTHPRWARRIAARVVGGALDAGEPVDVVLEAEENAPTLSPGSRSR